VNLIELSSCEILPETAALEFFNKDRGGIVVLLLQKTGEFPGPPDGILTYVQFPGQVYFEFIDMHGYSENMNRTSAFSRKK
jgi:hypothetical protein